MIDKDISNVDLFLYALVMVCGIFGGGAAAGHGAIHGKRMTFALVLAYCAVGAAFAMMMGALTFIYQPAGSVHSLVLWSVLAGLTAPMLLGAVYVGAKWQLKKRGKRVTMTLDIDADREEGRL